MSEIAVTHFLREHVLPRGVTDRAEPSAESRFARLNRSQRTRAVNDISLTNFALKDAYEQKVSDKHLWAESGGGRVVGGIGYWQGVGGIQGVLVKKGGCWGLFAFQDVWVFGGIWGGCVCVEVLEKLGCLGRLVNWCAPLLLVPLLFASPGCSGSTPINKPALT